MEPTIPTTKKEFPLRSIGLIICIVSVALLFIMALEAPKTLPKEGGVFTVRAGDSLKSIGTELKDQGIISSRLIFANLVVFYGGERHISPGDYYVAGGSTVFDVARQISTGDHALLPVKITIPEGFNIKEIADLLAQKLPEFPKDVFIQKATQYEGYLFPETYFFYPKVTVDDVVKQMHDMFLKKTADIFTSTSLTAKEKQIVVMASIIEREAHGDDDRAIIASILWKRFDSGMRLQVDVSPETYTTKGLPALPIGNPGLEALHAAINRTDTPYLYYLHDKHGSIHYAKTYAEHQKNITKYLK